MTEQPQPLPHQLSTQIAIPNQIPVAPTKPVALLNASRKEDAPEEEPYTIKCICNFSDDDGNTIYCETCDTWQHIGCYYPDSREEALREDFAHSCAECNPRNLDIQKAIERTRRLKTTAAVPEEAPDKKPKRPPSKNSHKKRTKPIDLQLNGHAPGQAVQDIGKPPQSGDPTPPPAKKAKSSHRPSASTSSVPNKRSPSYSNGRTQGHPPSPATTPPDLPLDFEMHNYSARFLSLYDSEPETEPQKATGNSFSSLATSNAMSLWLRDPDRMKQETGHSYDDVFQKLPADIDTQKRELIVQEKQHTLTPDATLRVKYLATPVDIEKDVPLIELFGQIGFQKDYCADPENIWEDLSSPLPFVFFHPMLPLCIDTRNERSPGRYVRRSCKPNAQLETYLSNTSEYHFWLVSDRFIAADEQITLPWDFRLPNAQKARMLHLINLGDDDTTSQDEPEMNEVEYQSISSWLHRVLSECGGCACGLGSNCAFVRFHRQYHSRIQARSQTAKKKARKQKVHTISPTSTGHASNSRAASESHMDDPDQDGARSASERSKPPSRDRTPMRHGSLDRPEILTEPTDRDKRKVQMVEDSFRRMEQHPRKKKRTSDGSSTKSKPKGTVNGTTRYVDAATSRSKSGSPASAHSANGQAPFRPPGSGAESVSSQSRPASSAPRAQYCDAAVQTDPVAGEWFSPSSPPPKPRRRIISLSQRLLNNRHRTRQDGIERKQRRESEAAQEQPATPMVIDTTAEQQSVLSSPIQDSHSNAEGVEPQEAAETDDIAMTDASAESPVRSKPTPSTAEAIVNGSNSPKAKEMKPPELRVELPPVPAFSNSTSGNVKTPQSAAGSIAQSPFSATNLPSPFVPANTNGLVQPSPIKKKLSLSDYTKSRKAAAAAAASKPTDSVKIPIEQKPVLDTIIDIPGAEKTSDAAATGNPQTNGVGPDSMSTTTKNTESSV